jgi:hypothetical protein
VPELDSAVLVDVVDECVPPDGSWSWWSCWSSAVGSDVLVADVGGAVVELLVELVVELAVELAGSSVDG